MFKELFTGLNEAKGSSIKDLQKVIKKQGQVMVITGGTDIMVVIDSIEDGYAYGLDQFDNDVEIDLKKEKVTISEAKNIKVIFPFFGLKTKDRKKYTDIAKSNNVAFDSTWDSSNPDEYRMNGTQKDIEKFLKEIGKEKLINQI